MNRRLLGVTVFAACLLALLLCAAALGGGYQRWYWAEQAIEEMSQALSRLDEGERKQQLRLAKWYNFCLGAKEPQEGYEAAYEGILNISQGMMGCLEFPGLGLSVPLYHNTGTQARYPSAGHVPGSALPIGGRDNHTVLTVPSEAAKLGQGDVFCVHILDETLYYLVREEKYVSPGQTAGLLPEEGEDLCSLTTHAAQGMEARKYILHGVRITEAEAQVWLQEVAGLSSREKRALDIALRAAVVTLFLPVVTWGTGRLVQWLKHLRACKRLTKNVC